MAERAAESGDWHLHDIDLDAIAAGHLPHGRYRSAPAPAWNAWNAQPPGLGHGFWSYPPPPPDTQAGIDYDQFAYTDDGNPYA
jgi:hypothetical protein